MSEPQWEDRLWGRAKRIADKKLAVSMLQTKAKTASAVHFYESRCTEYRVVSGVIVIVKYRHEGNAERRPVEHARIELTPGEAHKVNAGVIHGFEVIEPGYVVEIQWGDGSQPIKLNDVTEINPERRLSN